MQVMFFVFHKKKSRDQLMGFHDLPVPGVRVVHSTDNKKQKNRGPLLFRLQVSFTHLLLLGCGTSLLSLPTRQSGHNIIDAQQQAC